MTLAKAAVARATATPDDAIPVAAAMNTFGFELYRHLASGGSNLVFSPASIELALAMARPGARGATGAQMDAVMREASSDQMAAGLNALDAALASRTGSFSDSAGDDHSVALRIANSAFAQRDLPFEAAYLEALASRFDAGIRLVDYVADAEAARALVNGWVLERTEGRIPELLAEGTLDASTRLVLANAIYLKAAWRAPFMDHATRERPFTLPDGSTVQAPTMAGVSMTLPHGEGGGWSAVQLPYIGEALAMTVIVPDDLGSFEGQLSEGRFEEIVGAMKPRSVQLAFPRFDITGATELAPQLSAMGMPLAFDSGRADFSGMTAAERLFIGAAIHQAGISVDEATEAAAATAIVMRTSNAARDALQLRVDRPFLFAVRDVPTGAILFLGRITNPNAG
jgi:serpin B